jgi:hypothetical protein
VQTKRRMGILALLMLVTGLSQAQAGNRLSAFNIQCIGQSKASLVAHVHFTNGTQRIISQACTSTARAGTAPWPEIADSSGNVQSMTLSLHVNHAGNVALTNACTATSTNGYATAQCLADLAGIEEVRVLLSIPDIH